MAITFPLAIANFLAIFRCIIKEISRVFFSPRSND